AGGGATSGTAAPTRRSPRRFWRPAALGAGLLGLVGLVGLGVASWMGVRPAGDFPAPVATMKTGSTPDSADTAYRRGLRALEDWDLGAALVDLERATAEDADNPLVHRAASEIFFLAGQIDAARRSARRAESLVGGTPSPEKRWIAGWKALAEMRWQDAERDFRELIERAASESASVDTLPSSTVGPEHAAFGLLTALLEGGAASRAADVARDLGGNGGRSGRGARVDLLAAEAILRSGDAGRAERAADALFTEARAANRRSLAARALLLRGEATFRRGETAAGLADLDGARGLADPGNDLHTLGRILFRTARLHFVLGDFERAHSSFSGALTVAESVDDVRLEASALGHLAVTARSFNQSERSRELFSRAEDILEDLGDEIRLAGLRLELFFIAAQDARHDLGNIRGLIDEALRGFEKADADQPRAELLTRVAALDLTRGRIDSARDHLLRAIPLFESANNVFGLALAEHDLAYVYELQGEFSSSARFATRALERMRSADNPRMVAACLVRLARTDIFQGRIEPARRRLEQALEIRHRQGSVPRIEITRIEIIRLKLLEGRYAEAEAEALALEQNVTPNSRLWRLARRIRLKALIRQGRAEDAAPLLPETFTPDADSYICCFWRLVEVELLLETGSLDRADQVARETAAELETAGTWIFWAELELLRGRLDHRQGRPDRARDRLQALRQEAMARRWHALASESEERLAEVTGATSGSPR
ncbi:MAG: tetratricopeptide repeat protein, partial [Acidobacteriota bacterium]